MRNIARENHKRVASLYVIEISLDLHKFTFDLHNV